MIGIKWLVILIALVLATAISDHAQTNPTPTPKPKPVPTVSPSLEHEFFKNILRDQKAIWTAPLHVERSDAKWMIPSAIGFGALLATDRISGDEISEANGQLTASRAISYAGSVYGLGAAAGTFYLLGRKTNNYRARETGLLSAEALIDSMIVEGALKGISQRGRPMTGRERSEFFEGGNSFPSGHATQVWAVATVIASEYKHRRAVQFAAYGVATAVSVARFTGQKHYLSDVLAGSALGFGIGRYVYGAHHRDDSNPTLSAWPRITPELNRAARRYGVGLTWNF
jgi:membrane-associated phospholipid phosphatase